MVQVVINYEVQFRIFILCPIIITYLLGTNNLNVVLSKVMNLYEFVCTQLSRGGKKAGNSWLERDSYLTRSLLDRVINELACY